MSPAQLAAAATALSGDTCYITRFHDYRGHDGWYRKYRLVFVGGAVFPVHLAIGADWLLHYWRATMTGWMRDEEDAFLADHKRVFTGRAADALVAIGRRLGLDFAGLDCALLPDGQVLVFEANATMLVRAAGTTNPKRAQAERIRDAMTRLIVAAAGKQGEGAALDPLGPRAPDPNL